ncbi:MAG: TatD family hydrolase [Alistipes sp.]|nr:TatD family hydrolase [Alistipes sp.]
MKLIDTHSHIYEPEFDVDREQTVERALAAGVATMLLPAIDPAGNDRMFDLVRRHPQSCLPMIGLHPTSVNGNPRWREDLNETECLLRQPPEGIRFVGIGEIGLDFYWSEEFRAEQTEAFRRQCRWAVESGLPVAIHTRNAYAEMMEIMEEFRGSGLRGVFHAFSEDAETYRRLRSCGDFVFGIGGVVTYKKAQIARTVCEIPLDDIVLETDCPYLTPVPFRGSRNESSYVVYVCRRIAELKGVSEEEVAAVTTRNAERMFPIVQSRFPVL